MKTQFGKIALAAALGLAITFTLSCSDDKTAMALPDCGSGTYCGSQNQANHRGICPEGWHIPSNTEWDALYHFADDTDEFGFAALPGGSWWSVVRNLAKPKFPQGVAMIKNKLEQAKARR
jgi:hypothetical protein